MLQFLLNLSIQQATGAVRCRIDFKYALALELDDQAALDELARNVPHLLDDLADEQLAKRYGRQSVLSVSPPVPSAG